GSAARDPGLHGPVACAVPARAHRRRDRHPAAARTRAARAGPRRAGRERRGLRNHRLALRRTRLVEPLDARDRQRELRLPCLSGQDLRRVGRRAGRARVPAAGRLVVPGRRSVPQGRSRANRTRPLRKSEMDPILGGALIIAAMLAVAAIGLPVGLSMAAVGFVGMYLLAGAPFALGTFMTLPYSIASQYAFVVVPMFVLMGAFASTSGMTSEMYTAAHRLFSGMRGGLYYTTVLASAAFGAVSGSTIVAGAVFTRIAFPEMMRYGYRRSLSAGSIAAAGTFAALIPPSISMVIYGILTGESIGALLMAGLVP